MDFSTKGRSQFIQQLEDFIARTEKQDIMDSLQFTDKPVETFETLKVPEEIDLTEDVLEPIEEQPVLEPAGNADNLTDKNMQIEAVMNSGMQFLSGLFKMTTGKDMGLENQKVEVDRTTGEIIMRFKIPV